MLTFEQSGQAVSHRNMPKEGDFMTDRRVFWKRCGTDLHWCNLARLDLKEIKDIGVYIIWHGGQNPRVVRIGQGNISDRLSQHRSNSIITSFGELFVTWTAVASQFDRDGIEKHLAEVWQPLVGEAFPNVAPISVNSPFS